ncbi:toll-like receptor 13 [Liolophura sinensis]|uniref:toll-like receptor 13 n=1 Tax=Liolophura sinensis TaxID=3198878 RepID=UPI0031597259
MDLRYTCRYAEKPPSGKEKALETKQFFNAENLRVVDLAYSGIQDSYNFHNYQWACIVLRSVLENENNYTLCLHDRDFPVGVSIQQNIVDAVNNSRKVILVISRAFLTSDWCEFEIQMTGMRMMRDGRENAIIVIMIEEIPVAEMPRSLLNLWKHITFLLWDNERADEPEFWDRLLEVMARPQLLIITQRKWVNLSV